MASTVMILVFAESLLLSYLNPFVISYKLLYPPILDLGKVWAMEWVCFLGLDVELSAPYASKQAN